MSTSLYPNLAGINYESLVDGEGVRATIYLSGCSHNCPGCHNPESHDPNYGTPITAQTIQNIAQEIAKRPFLKGITLSGGDPFYCPEKTFLFITHLFEELHNLVKNKQRYNLWVYTGAMFGELYYADNLFIHPMLLLTDVLVDGPFIQSLANKTLHFRGSSNQRIIDVQKTLEKGEIIIHHTQEDTQT